MEPKRVLLVSAEGEQTVIDCLQHANCFVMKARSGEAALDFAKHVAIDAFVLISTGSVMGRTETALNLRDIRPCSEIILVTRNHGTPTQGEMAARAIPNTLVLTLQELHDHLASVNL